jgi:hypothetical protein
VKIFALPPCFFDCLEGIIYLWESVDTYIGAYIYKGYTLRSTLKLS